MTDEAVFLKALAARPDDATTRLVYADWLNEAGRGDEAFAQRWMARTGLRPGYRTSTVDTGRLSPGSGSPRRPAAPFRWAWWPEGAPGSSLRPPHALLPPPVFRALTGWHPSTDHRYYPSEEAAVADLARALAELRRVLGLNG